MFEFNEIREKLKSAGIKVKSISTHFLSSVKNRKGYKVVADSLHDTKDSTISPEVAAFIANQGIGVDNIPESLNIVVNGSNEAKKRDYDYTLLSNPVFYDNTIIDKIAVKDIIGSVRDFESTPLLEFVSSLYHRNFEYGNRSLDFLDRSIDSNLEDISNSSEPIKFMQIGDKYYVNMDGNHRAFYLLLSYLIKKHVYADNEKMLGKIENKFVIKAEVQKKSSYTNINKIFYCLLKSGIYDLKIEFTNKDNSIAILRYEGKEIMINSEKDFLCIFREYFNSLDKTSDKYKYLHSWLSYIGYFGNNVNKQNDVQEVDNHKKL